MTGRQRHRKNYYASRQGRDSGRSSVRYVTFFWTGRNKKIEDVADECISYRENTPISADMHAKYTSSLKFGAILICARPITQTAYNDEKLLRRWVAENKKELSVRHGSQLCRYGLFLVTKTYRTPQASINASMEKRQGDFAECKHEGTNAGRRRYQAWCE